MHSFFLRAAEQFEMLYKKCSKKNIKKPDRLHRI